MNCLKSTQSLRGDSLLLATKSPEVPGIQMIALGRLEGWVKYGNSWLWTRNSLNGNMASEPLINHCSFRLDISPTDFLKLEVWCDSSGITRLFVQNSDFTDSKIRFPYWSLYRFFKCFFSVLFSSFFLLHENYSSPFFLHLFTLDFFMNFSSLNINSIVIFCDNSVNCGTQNSYNT